MGVRMAPMQWTGRGTSGRIMQRGGFSAVALQGLGRGWRPLFQISRHSARDWRCRL